jgi:hypothetical protein
MKMPWRTALCALAWCAAALGTVGAQTAPAGGGAVISAPVTPDAVKYLSGGAGDEERSQLQTQWPQYPLMIVFSAAGGAYAVPDSVRVTNAQGAVVLDVAQAGPMLMLNLPPGDYHVLARSGGAEQQREVTLSAQPQRLDWRL